MTEYHKLPPGALSGRYHALKDVDQPKVTDATLTNDDEIVLKDIGIGNYDISGWLSMIEEANNPNMKFRLNNQDGLEGNITYFIHHYGSFDKEVNLMDFTSDTGEIEFSASKKGNSLINGLLRVTKAGTLALQWAQFSNDVDSITLLKDSYLRLTAF